MSRAAMGLLGACVTVGAMSGARAAPEEPPAWGTASPTVLEYASPMGDVIVMCQARADTNGDGKIEVTIDSEHGDTYGDDMRPYLCLGPQSGQHPGGEQ